MLKFLTHKLRTHSLNEEIVFEKAEERDSGTESDDEADRPEEITSDVIMKWNEVTDISMSEECCACAPRLSPPTPDADQLYDHHSSEEELEVINGAPLPAPAPESRRRGASSPPPAAPEKRRWPDPSPARPLSDDDDDVKIETPVRFRSSPPREVLRPRRSVPCACPRPGLALSSGPTSGLSGLNSGLSYGLNAGLSTGFSSGLGSGLTSGLNSGAPDRRARRRHRPQLDFDKMQQLKVGGGGVTSWRQVGGAGGELSVFCW